VSVMKQQTPIDFAQTTAASRSVHDLRLHQHAGCCMC
jgi:hypothetical protein